MDDDEDSSSQFDLYEQICAPFAGQSQLLSLPTLYVLLLDRARVLTNCTQTRVYASSRDHTSQSCDDIPLL